ncbi:calpain-10 isoform 2-T3 [Rhinophrynus dorsalis]
MSHTHMRGIAATSADSHSLLKGEMSSPLTGLFVDSEFPASVSSLVYGGGTPLSLFTDRITWRRPQDICASPHLFPENSRDSLGKQGILGDCWFICACSALQKYDHLLNQVFPSDQCTWNDPGYLGQFTCRFWHFGHWVEVTIDDLLPCLGNKLCFSHCQDQGAFWLPLLEKAYAKLHGCYEALWAGQVADALMDLTGGLVERWNLGSEEDPIREKLFSKIVEIKDKCAMSCSILRCREGNGEWGECHAFTITDIQQMVTKDSQELLLLRVHNPWGRSCWGGPWRKGGDGWAELNQTDISRLISETQEGEFWVEKTEFMQEFDEITVAFPVNEEGYLQSIQTGQPLLHTQQICGSWVKGKSAGGSRNNASFPDNPKYWLRVKEPSEVCLALMQKPRDGKELSSNVHGVLRRAVRPYRADLNAVGLHVWKVEKRHFNLHKTLSSPPVAGTSSHAYNRQLQLCCDLSPGYHLLIPSTFVRETEGDFLLRVLSTGHINLSEVTTSRGVAAVSENSTPGKWETQELHGHWEKGKSAGGCRNFSSYHQNPCLPFSVPTGASQVRLMLRQLCQGEKCHAIGFHVYSIPKNSNVSPHSLEPCVSCIPHSHSQEVSKLCSLSPGQYILVPSTYLPDQESNFTVTIATKSERKPIQSRETLGQFLQEVSVVKVMK